MKRYIVALLIAGGALVTAPRSSEAGVIPWTYNAIFSPGPAFGYYSGYAPYSAGYAPFYGYGARYSASYSYAPPAYGGGAGCCGVANYAPSWGYGCCAPANPCCGTCVAGCDSGCAGGNCSGCGVGTAATGPSDSGGSEPTPAGDAGRGSTPRTYDPAVDPSRRTTPNDDFEAGNRNPIDRNRSRGPEDFGGDGTGGVNSKSEAPPFDRPAPADPKGDPDARVMPPIEPVNLDAKVAYRAPANFKRVQATAKFRLPSVVRTMPATPGDQEQTPTAVAAK